MHIAANPAASPLHSLQRARLRQQSTPPAEPVRSAPARSAPARDSEPADPARGDDSRDAATGASRSEAELSEEERRQVAELRQRDREVRAHEQAHKARAGRYARGAPRFETERGPDGREYAVGGEVQIDTSEVRGDPRATLRKMEQIQRAALAPAEPSAQDRGVAAEAAASSSRARRELREEGADSSGRDPAARPGRHIDVQA